MNGRRFLVASLIAGAVSLGAGPAAADVSGGCDGQAVIDGITYTPANDSADNPIVIPDADGIVVPIEGMAPFDNNGHSGQIRLHLGPGSVQLAEWADDNGPEPNSNSADEVYALDGLRDELPFDVRGLYRVSGVHEADGGACEGFVMLKFDGAVMSSPVMIGAATTGVVGLFLLVLAAIAVAAAAPLVRGRRWLGVLGGLLFGLSFAVVLQQLSLWPLDTISTIGLPLLFLALGVLLAFWAPLGRTRLAFAGDPAVISDPSSDTTGSETDPVEPHQATDETGTPTGESSGDEQAPSSDEQPPTEQPVGAPAPSELLTDELLTDEPPVGEPLPGTSPAADPQLVDPVIVGDLAAIEVADTTTAPRPVPPALVNGKDPCKQLRDRVNRRVEELERIERERRKFEEKVGELEKKLEEFDREHGRKVDGERRTGTGGFWTNRRKELQNELETARDFANGLERRVYDEQFQQDVERLKACEKRAIDAALAAQERRSGGSTPGGSRPDDGSRVPCCEARTWIGINIYGGGQFFVGGVETGYVLLWCTSDRARSAIVEWSGTRIGPGLGGELSAGLFLLRGPHHPSETPLAVAKVLTGFDGDLSVGVSVTKTASLLNTARKHHEAVPKLLTALGRHLGSASMSQVKTRQGIKLLQSRLGHEVDGLTNNALDNLIDSALKSGASAGQAGGTGVNIPIPLPSALQVGVWKLCDVQTTLMDVSGCRMCDPAGAAARSM